MPPEHLSEIDVPAMVERALLSMAKWVDDGAFTPLNVRNVIVNQQIGPELPYRRVLHALSRSPRVRRMRKRHPADSLLSQGMRQPRYVMVDFEPRSK